MTQPPVDPTPTEPVPALDPSPAPADTAAPPAWVPAPPEGTAPPAPAATTRRAGGPSRPLAIVLGAVLLVGALGVAFAAGRVTAPAADGVGTGGVSSREDAGTGDDGDRSGRGGALPDGSFDLDGDLDGDGRGGPGVDMDGDGAFPGRGPGREGVGGAGITGTVTGVDGDTLTIQTVAGRTVTVSLDEGTTYHQQAPATRADVTTGDTVQVQLSGGFRPGRSADGSTIDLGTAGDVTIVP